MTTATAPRYKSVILFNKRDNSYILIGMNYLPEDALSELKALEGLNAFTLDQDGELFTSESQVESRMHEITQGRVVRY